MQAILEFFKTTLNDVAWLYILLPCVAIGGIFFTIRNRGVQFTRLGTSLKLAVGKNARTGKDKEGSVSAFQALTTALAATVGTGNIVGTCQAVAMGGYGAIFWLWIAALLGMVIKYAEVVLAVHYRERNKKGDWVGGPMYYIVNGMGKGWKWLAVLFTLFAVLASFGIGNFSQINSITDSFNGAVTAFSPATAAKHGETIALVVGILLAVITAFALLGGIKRIGKITALMIPFMSILYIIFTLVVIGKNYANIGGAFSKIFSAAFSSKAVLGAASGIAVKEAIIWGLRRSAFSNEAGLGSAGIAHAAAETDSAVKQGLYGIFEVFADTLVICTLTGLTVAVSNVPVSFGTAPGSSLITAAFSTVFGNKFAALFVAISLMFFAYSTVLGWSLYGTRCIEHLFGMKATKIYQLIFVAGIVLAATTLVNFDDAMALSDTFNGLMAIPNFIALFALSGVVAKLTKEYFRDKTRLS